jgi:hypothetical protein
LLSLGIIGQSLKDENKKLNNLENNILFGENGGNA